MNAKLASLISFWALISSNSKPLSTQSTSIPFPSAGFRARLSLTAFSDSYWAVSKRCRKRSGKLIFGQTKFLSATSSSSSDGMHVAQSPILKKQISCVYPEQLPSTATSSLHTAMTLSRVSFWQCSNNRNAMPSQPTAATPSRAICKNMNVVLYSSGTSLHHVRFI